MTISIGTSGWSYDHWQPELYPPGLPAAARLSRYADVFPTVELNSSFYRWPGPAAFRNWRDRLPDGFRLSVKAPRGLTHARRLYAPETWLQRIRAGWHELGGRRAVLLVQLPPAQPRDDLRLAYFLRQVPPWIRVAAEFRHPSWHCEETFSLLAEHRAAYCVMSGAGLPCVLRSTTDFVYLRMHGPDHHFLYAGSYPDADLTWWADRIREWSLAGQDVFVYFNNDGDANAVRNARSLQALLVPGGAAVFPLRPSASGRIGQAGPSSRRAGPGFVSIEPDHSPGGGSMPGRNQASQRVADAPGPERPGWLFLIAGGLIYAGTLLGMWIVLAGQPDIQDLVVGSAAAVLAVAAGYLVSERGQMVPSARVADLRTLARVPWQVVAETGQVFALAARKAAGRPVAPGALRTVPVDAGTDMRGWPAARREAVLTALLSAAPNTIVVDIDMAAGTALVHQLAGAPEPSAPDSTA